MKAEFKIKKSKSEGVTLWVKGDLTVSYSKEFKDRLLELLIAPSKGSVEISLREVTAIDVSAIQLLRVAGLELLKGGNKISMIWPDNEALNTLITKTGIKQAL